MIHDPLCKAGPEFIDDYGHCSMCAEFERIRGKQTEHTRKLLEVDLTPRAEAVYDSESQLVGDFSDDVTSMIVTQVHEEMADTPAVGDIHYGEGLYVYNGTHWIEVDQEGFLSGLTPPES